MFLQFGMRVCSAERVHLSGCSYHLAWLCVQRKAGALQQVFLPFGTHVCSAEPVHFSGCSYHLACVCVCSDQRVHFSGCSYHMACVCAVPRGCTSAGVLTIWHACAQRRAGVLQRVFLPFGTHVCSAERVHCSYHLACVCAVTSGCTSAGVLTIWHACVQCRAGALELLRLPFGVRVCAALSGCS